MWIDIVLAIIFVLSTAQGLKAGFISTLFHSAGWIASLVLAFLSYPFVSDLIRNKTILYDSIYDRIFLKLNGDPPVSEDQMAGGFPSIMENLVDSARNNMATVLATSFSTIIFHIAIFIAMAILIRIAFLIISSIVGVRRGRGLTGFADGFLGMIMGAVRGILLIFIFLAVLIPISNLSSGMTISTALETSFFAGTLYDNNLLLLIIKDLL